jgi:hypothetical protein
MSTWPVLATVAGGSLRVRPSRRISVVALSEVAAAARAGGAVGTAGAIGGWAGRGGGPIAFITTVGADEAGGFGT